MRGGIAEEMMWIFAVFAATAALSAAQQITKTSFSCNGHATGYYADVETGCQVYHMCDGLGRQFSYTCPNATLFQQRMLICDHWYMVNCSRATEDYSANLLIGQRNRPFVEDSESNPYSRTPRPDLLVAPSNLTEYNIIYRTGGQNLSPRNFVGVASDDESVTDQPTYFPPSHWSTEVTKSATTPPSISQNVNDRAYKIRGKAIDFSSVYKDRNNLADNFKPNFKVTATPYQQSVADSTNGRRSTQNTPINKQASVFFNPNRQYQSDDELSKDLRQRLQEIQFNVKSNYNAATTPVYPNSVDAADQLGVLPPQKNIVNFYSDFRATTPQYPTYVESTSQAPDEAGLLPPKEDAGKLQSHGNRVLQHFESNFRATTPNYPTFVDQTSPDPADAGLLPPEDNHRVVNFASNFKATTPQYPSRVDPTSPDPREAGVLPPNGIKVNFESNFAATTPRYPTHVDASSLNADDVGLLPPDGTSRVPFKSRFRATTPNYPTFVPLTSPDPLGVGLVAPEENALVNFHSDYKATTPNYPTYVEATSPDAGEAGLLAPRPDDGGVVRSRQPDERFTNPVKFYQPPSVESDYNVGEEELQEIPGIKLLNFMKSFNDQQWQELRHAFRIPEYDFPLDDATRPSYDSVVDSFKPLPPSK